MGLVTVTFDMGPDEDYEMADCSVREQADILLDILCVNMGRLLSEYAIEGDEATVKLDSGETFSVKNDKLKLVRHT